MSIQTTGWPVRITHPVSSNVLSPDVTADPVFIPSANDLPRVQLPVEKADKWSRIIGSGSANPSMEVYHRGTQLPIDELIEATPTPGATTLVGWGGTELLQTPDTPYEWTLTEMDEAAKEVIGDTSYQVNVDDYPETLETVTAQEADETGEYDDIIVLDGTSSPRQPYRDQNTNLELVQVCHHGHDQQTDLFSAGGSPAFGHSETGAVDGEAVILEDSGDYVRFENITLEKDFLATGTSVALRIQGSCNDADIKVDGVTEQSVAAINGNDEGTGDWSWVTFEGLTAIDPSGNDHTCGIELTEDPDDGGGERLLVDCIVLYDVNHGDFTFPSDTDANDEIAGPELYAESETVIFVNYLPTARGIRSASLSSSWDDTSGSQFVRIVTSNASFTTNNGTDTSTGALSSLDHFCRMVVEMTRYGTRTDESPTQGFEGQKLQEIELTVELSDEPFIVHQKFDGTLKDILNELADTGDALWEYRRDGDTESVEWAQPGQRTRSNPFDVSDFEAVSSVEQLVDTVRIYGKEKTRTESFTSDHGNWVDLDQNKITGGSEFVDDGSGGDYSEGTNVNDDYEMDYENGRIKTSSDGDLSDSTSFDIEYSYKAYGEFTDTSVSGRTIIRDFPSAPTDRACETIAFILVNQLNTPLRKGEIIIPGGATDFSIVESLDVATLPFGTDTIEVRQIRGGEGQSALTVGSRKPQNEVISDVRQRVEQLARVA